jgi:hypothetical protein
MAEISVNIPDPFVPRLLAMIEGRYSPPDGMTNVEKGQWLIRHLLRRELIEYEGILLEFAKRAEAEVEAEAAKSEIEAALPE